MPELLILFLFVLIYVYNLIPCRYTTVADTINTRFRKIMIYLENSVFTNKKETFLYGRKKKKKISYYPLKQ